MSQIDRNLFLNRNTRHASRQHRKRLLISGLIGALFSVGALTTLQAASSGSEHWSAKAPAHGAASRLMNGVDTAGAAPDALTYAALIATSKPAEASPAPVAAVEAAPQATDTAAEAAEAQKAAAEAVAEARLVRAEAVLSAIDHWAEAWQQKDVPAYLAAYGEGFQPANGATRDEWAKLREQRIVGKREIELKLHDIDVVFESNERAVVKFVQDYRADQFVERGTAKSMVLALQQDGWRILAEESAR